MRSRSITTLVLVGLFSGCGGDAKTAAFMTAVKNGDPNSVRSSIAQGIDVNVKDSSGNLILKLAGGKE